MEGGRSHSTAAGPPLWVLRCRNERRTDATPPTCDRFAPLEICELAHRDRTGRPLRLGSHPFPEADIRHHLETERCPVCRRWYDNACSEYARLGPQVRLAAFNEVQVCHELPRLDHTSGLNALPLVLRWHADPDNRPQSPAWRLQLTAHASRGNKSRLTRYNGRSVRLTLQRTDGGSLVSVETRLGFDPNGNLVSAEEVVPLDPRGDLNVTLQLRPRARQARPDEGPTP